jgi:guanylate kinase
MSRLIILNGASGAGKTFSMEEMPKVDAKIVPIMKYTTRGPRSFENESSPIDLIFNYCPKKIEALKYKYEYVGHQYGIDLSQIECALSKGKIPIVIVRNYEVIIELKRDFPSALTFYIHSAYTGEELKKILTAQGRQDIDINERRQRERENFNDYMKYLRRELFDHHIYNYYDDSLIAQMRFYLSKYEGRYVQ